MNPVPFFPSVEYSETLRAQPLFDLTLEMLNCVRDHNADAVQCHCHHHLETDG